MSGSAACTAAGCNRMGKSSTLIEVIAMPEGSLCASHPQMVLQRLIHPQRHILQREVPAAVPRRRRLGAGSYRDLLVGRQQQRALGIHGRALRVVLPLCLRAVGCLQHDSARHTVGAQARPTSDWTNTLEQQ